MQAPLDTVEACRLAGLLLQRQSLDAVLALHFLQDQQLLVEWVELTLAIARLHWTIGETAEACLEYEQALAAVPMLIIDMDYYSVALMLEGKIDVLHKLYLRLQTDYPDRVETHVSALALFQIRDISKARQIIVAMEQQEEYIHQQLELNDLNDSNHFYSESPHKFISSKLKSNNPLINPIINDNPFFIKQQQQQPKNDNDQFKNDGPNEKIGSEIKENQFHTEIIIETVNDRLNSSKSLHNGFSNLDSNECFILLRARNFSFEDNIENAINDFNTLLKLNKGSIYGYEGLVASYLELGLTTKALQLASEIGKAMANNPRVMILAAKVLDKVSDQESSSFATTLLHNALITGNSKIHWTLEKGVLDNLQYLLKISKKSSVKSKFNHKKQKILELNELEKQTNIIDGYTEISRIISKQDMEKLREGRHIYSEINTSSTKYRKQLNKYDWLKQSGVDIVYRHLGSKELATSSLSFLKESFIDDWELNERESLFNENGELITISDHKYSSTDENKSLVDYLNLEINDNFDLLGEDPLNFTKDTTSGIGIGGLGIGIMGGFPSVNSNNKYSSKEDTDMHIEYSLNNIDFPEHFSRIKPGICSNGNAIESFLTLSQIYESFNKPNKARKLLENALLIIPSPILHVRLAEIFIEMKKYSKAFNEINTAFVMDPENELIQERFSRILNEIENNDNDFENDIEDDIYEEEYLINNNKILTDEIISGSLRGRQL